MQTPDRSLAINSAALQDHLLRSMGLKPPAKRSKPLPKPPSNLSKLGRSIISKNSSTILSSDPTMEQVRKKEQAYKDQLTLAQRLGLVEAPPAPLSENQWVEVEQQAVHRGMHTGNCPICHESLGKNPSVILSCSHIFHTQCLKSFEKFAGAKSCPICRKQAYDKKRIQLTEKYYRDQCIIKIQKWVRGFLARRRFKRLRKLHPPQHPLVRRKYFGEQLSELTSKMDSYLSKREKDIDQLFSDLDIHLEESRQAIAQMRMQRHNCKRQEKAEEPLRQVDWKRVRAQAEMREEHNCAICLNEFGSGKRCILSCSHVFHARCMEGLEFYDIREEHCCPICRSSYSRVDL